MIRFSWQNTRTGKELNIRDLNVDMEPDYRDFVAFYPRLLGRLVIEFMGYEGERLRAERRHTNLSEALDVGLNMSNFIHAVKRLKNVQPYAGRCESVPDYPKIVRDIQELSRRIGSTKDAQKGSKHDLS